MSDAEEMAARHKEILTELAQLGLALVRDLQAEVLAATDKAKKAELTLAYHRAARSVRQTLALEARLLRERQRAEREEAVVAAKETEARVQIKRRRVRRAAADDIWTEYEPDEAEPLLEALSGVVFDLSEEDGFLEASLETLLPRIRQALGLPANEDLALGGGRGPTKLGLTHPPILPLRGRWQASKAKPDGGGSLSAPQTPVAPSSTRRTRRARSSRR